MLKRSLLEHVYIYIFSYTYYIYMPLNKKFPAIISPSPSFSSLNLEMMDVMDAQWMSWLETGRFWNDNAGCWIHSRTTSSAVLIGSTFDMT